MSMELLAPAGDLERLRMAVAYGADAVYLAGTSFGMRAFAGNFNPDELREAVKLCHTHGVKVHVTCNTMPRNDEVSRLPAWLELLDEVGVDAVIVADLGFFQLAGRYAPRLKRHISTQAGVTNYAVAAAWHELGADRVILARELSLEEVAELLNDGTITVAQLHGHEDEAYLAALRALAPGKELWKAYKVRSEADLAAAAASTADQILLDNGYGTGQAFDWSLAGGVRRPFLLAGGLTPENIPDAVARLHPMGLDISSGVETGRQKDRAKILAAVAAARKE